MMYEDAKVLIGDDSILSRKRVKDVLLSLGFQHFREAENGQQVIDLYKEEKADLVFLDIVMPVKDGNDAIDEIMAFDPDAQIIIVSSVGTQAQLKRAIEKGANDFIQKPINAKQIEDVVKNRLERG